MRKFEKFLLKFREIRGKLVKLGKFMKFGENSGKFEKILGNSGKYGKV